MEENEQLNLNKRNVWAYWTLCLSVSQQNDNKKDATISNFDATSTLLKGMIVFALQRMRKQNGKGTECHEIKHLPYRFMPKNNNNKIK